jgi:hypothetical protein
MTFPPSNPPRAGLNLGVVLRSLWLPLLVWVVSLAVFVALNYPPILCVTPLAWVLALYTGRVCGQGAGLAEAGLAGGLLGLAQGVLFGLATVLLAPSEPAEAVSALLRGAGIGLGGLAGCATLSLLAAAWSRRSA